MSFLIWVTTTDLCSALVHIPYSSRLEGLLSGCSYPTLLGSQDICGSNLCLRILFSCGIWRFRCRLVWDCVVTPLLTFPSDWYRQFRRVITVFTGSWLPWLLTVCSLLVWSSVVVTEVTTCTSRRVMESLSHVLLFLCLNSEIDLTLNTISSPPSTLSF